VTRVQSFHIQAAPGEWSLVLARERHSTLRATVLPFCHAYRLEEGNCSTKASDASPDVKMGKPEDVWAETKRSEEQKQNPFRRDDGRELVRTLSAPQGTEGMGCLCGPELPRAFPSFGRSSSWFLLFYIVRP
jgi:hypothetical protein